MGSSYSRITPLALQTVKYRYQNNGNVDLIHPVEVIQKLSNSNKEQSRDILEYLKLCLDYCSQHWIVHFCQSNGVLVLFQVLNESLADEDEETATLCLSCIRSLISKYGAMDLIANDRRLIRVLPKVLDSNFNEAKKLALELLVKLLYYSRSSYRSTIRAFIGHYHASPTALQTIESILKSKSPSAYPTLSPLGSSKPAHSQPTNESKATAPPPLPPPPPQQLSRSNTTNCISPKPSQALTKSSTTKSLRPPPINTSCSLTSSPTHNQFGTPQNSQGEYSNENMLTGEGVQLNGAEKGAEGASSQNDDIINMPAPPVRISPDKATPKYAQSSVQSIDEIENFQNQIVTSTFEQNQANSSMQSPTRQGYLSSVRQLLSVADTGVDLDVVQGTVLFLQSALQAPDMIYSADLTERFVDGCIESGVLQAAHQLQEQDNDFINNQVTIVQDVFEKFKRKVGEQNHQKRQAALQSHASMQESFTDLSDHSGTASQAQAAPSTATDSFATVEPPSFTHSPSNVAPPPPAPPPPPLPRSTTLKSRAAPPIAPPPPLLRSLTCKPDMSYDAVIKARLSEGQTSASADSFIDNIPAPTKKMKSLFWDKVPHMRISGTFWDEIQRESYSNFVNFDEIQASFQAFMRAPPGKHKSNRKSLGILTQTRAMAVGVRMAKLRAQPSEIAIAVRTLDVDYFNGIDEIQLVLGCYPTAEELKQLSEAANNPDKKDRMSQAETFCYALAQIPRCQSRLQTLLLSFTAQETAVTVRRILNAQKAAISALRVSKVFSEILITVLFIGNFMNYGTRLGNCQGFRLSYLQKLCDVRSTDGKISLQQYLARVLTQRDVLNVASELPEVQQQEMGVSLSEVKDMLNEIRCALDSIEVELVYNPPRVAVGIQIIHDPNALPQSPTSSTSSTEENQLKPLKSVVSEIPAHQAQCVVSDTGATNTSPTRLSCLSENSDYRTSQSTHADSYVTAQSIEVVQSLSVENISELCHDVDTPKVVVSMELDRYHWVMTESAQQIKEQEMSLLNLYNDIKESFIDLLVYYGEPATMVGADVQFWQEVRQFVESFGSSQRLELQRQEQDAAIENSIRRSKSRCSSSSSGRSRAGSRVEHSAKIQSAKQRHGSGGSSGYKAQLCTVIESPDNSGHGNRSKKINLNGSNTEQYIQLYNRSSSVKRSQSAQAQTNRPSYTAPTISSAIYSNHISSQVGNKRFQNVDRLVHSPRGDARVGRKSSFTSSPRQRSVGQLDVQRSAASSQGKKIRRAISRAKSNVTHLQDSPKQQWTLSTNYGSSRSFSRKGSLDLSGKIVDS